MSKYVLFSLVVLGSVAAQARPLSTSMSCHSARALVNSEGAIVLATGDGLYDRYVSSQGYCYNDQVATPAWIPTADTAQCFVGYTCEQNSDGGGAGR